MMLPVQRAARSTFESSAYVADSTDMSKKTMIGGVIWRPGCLCINLCNTPESV